MTAGRPTILERATAIIAAFDGPASHLQIGTIADRSGLPRSTAHRLVDQLIQLGWIQRTSHGYSLGHRMALSDSGHMALRTAAAPLLQALHNETGAVAHLGVLDGDHVHILDRVCGRNTAPVPTHVGDHVPAHSTALGKAILASLTPEDVDRIIPAKLNHRTAKTITSRITLHAELGSIRTRHRVAYDNEEFAQSVNCIGVYIRCHGEERAALSLSGRTNLEAFVRMGPLVREAAGRIELRIGRSTESEPRTDPGADLTMLRVLNTVNADDWL